MPDGRRRGRLQQVSLKGCGRHEANLRKSSVPFKIDAREVCGSGLAEAVSAMLSVLEIGAIPKSNYLGQRGRWKELEADRSDFARIRNR